MYKKMNGDISKEFLDFWIDHGCLTVFNSSQVKWVNAAAGNSETLTPENTTQGLPQDLS
jgi:hypothetical protein